MIKKYNLKECLTQIRSHWDPHLLATLNGQHVKLVKIKGAFDWHAHDDEDELFLVVSGSFDMEMRDQTLTLNTGDMVVIPKGTEHRPHAREEASILLFEPAGTRNTGNRITAKTQTRLKVIR